MRILQRTYQRGAALGALVFTALLISSIPLAAVHAQPSTVVKPDSTLVRPYRPEADARADLDRAIAAAAAHGRHVLVQVGGNWCSWCRRLEALFANNDTIRGILERSYVRVHVNFSKENRNLPVLASLQYPQRFGFPVLVVLDASGRRLHTQDSGLLEASGAHDPERVRTFLEHWSPSALDPARYPESSSR